MPHQRFWGLRKELGIDAHKLPNSIDLLLQSGRTIHAIRLDDWRIDVGYPEDCDRAEERLDELAVDAESEENEEKADEAVVDG